MLTDVTSAEFSAVRLQALIDEIRSDNREAERAGDWNRVTRNCALIEKARALNVSATAAPVPAAPAPLPVPQTNHERALRAAAHVFGTVYGARLDHTFEDGRELWAVSMQGRGSRRIDVYLKAGESPTVLWRAMSGEVRTQVVAL